MKQIQATVFSNQICSMTDMHGQNGELLAQKKKIPKKIQKKRLTNTI